MKLMLLAFCLVFSTFSYGAETVVEFTQEEAKSHSIDNHQLKMDLVSVKRSLHKGNTKRALRIIDLLLHDLNHDNGDDDHGDVRVFGRLGIVYKNNPRYRCNHNDKERARQIGEQSALDFCYRSGALKCKVVNSSLVKNGFLGTINGVYYGYGCSYSAIAHGK